jgi:CheY-like chemotaxis protein
VIVMTEKPRILVVDDEPANLELLVRMLRRKYEVVTASSGREGLELLARERFAAILSDQRMPHMSGTEFLAQARRLVPDTVRMILTGYAPEKDSVDAINEAQVTMFLTKPVETDAVERAVADAVELHELHLRNERLAAELAEARRRLDEDDDGVLGERSFRERLGIELVRLSRYGGTASLCSLSPAGEHLAQALRIRPPDLVGRAGDTLFLLLPGTARAGAAALVARIQAALPDQHLASAVAEAPADGVDVETLLRAVRFPPA